MSRLESVLEMSSKKHYQEIPTQLVDVLIFRSTFNFQVQKFKKERLKIQKIIKKTFAESIISVLWPHFLGSAVDQIDIN